MLRRQEELARKIPVAPVFNLQQVHVPPDEDLYELYEEDYESIVIDTGMATVKVNHIPRFPFPGAMQDCLMGTRMDKGVACPHFPLTIVSCRLAWPVTMPPELSFQH